VVCHRFVKHSDHQQEILDRCVKEGEGYGGYWGDGKRAVHLSNVVRELFILNEQLLTANSAIAMMTIRK
jgi:hypothetical protein